jgi:uncharacterized protein (TIGR00299 family) protein
VSRVLYLDCVGGVAGDMLLSALVDAGADRSRIDALPEALGMPDVQLSWIRNWPGGFAAQQLEVAFDTAAHPHHRGLADMMELVDRCNLSPRVRTTAEMVFRRLAEAEAEVHGATLETVHFHEVGGVDALIDILGAAIALDDLGVERIVCSPLPMGSGTVECAHGTLPLPAPAVAAMLPGVPVRDAGVEGETVTPTGAALVTTLADAFGPMPAFTVERVGIGAGSRSFPNLPNIVRAFVGSAVAEALATTTTGAAIVECNVDDLDPRILPVIIDQLMEAGAMDASVTPIVMKKGRPGHLISALCAPERTDAVVAVLLRGTTSLGCRIHHVDKRHLGRRMETVTTPWGEVPVKVALDGDRVLRRVPEFEDCAALARKAGVPVRDVLAAASSSGDPE